jgi:hypothetical protein
LFTRTACDGSAASSLATLALSIGDRELLIHPPSAGCQKSEGLIVFLVAAVNTESLRRIVLGGSCSSARFPHVSRGEQVAACFKHLAELRRHVVAKAHA